MLVTKILQRLKQNQQLLIWSQILNKLKHDEEYEHRINVLIIYTYLGINKADVLPSISAVVILETQNQKNIYSLKLQILFEIKEKLLLEQIETYTF